VETRGIGFTPIHHRLAYTAQEEAAATHVPGREWAKTVVCIADGKPVLASLPANDRVGLGAPRPTRAPDKRARRARRKLQGL